MDITTLTTALIRILNLGLPSLTSAKWLDLMNDLADEKPFSVPGTKHFPDLAEAALAPSPAQLVRDVDPELVPSLRNSIQGLR